jgi:predicted nucleic acid-binding protein
LKAQSINLTVGAMTLAINYLSDAIFLLDLWREQQGTGNAIRFARDNSDAIVGLPWFAKGEFIKAVTYANFSIWDFQPFIEEFPTIVPTDKTLDFYAQAIAELRDPLSSFKPNDFWFIAVAREHRLPILTRNISTFSGIDGLQVINYGETVSQ